MSLHFEVDDEMAAMARVCSFLCGPNTFLIYATALYSADRLAHEEAVQNGGLIMYWYGVPDPETGLNLATCIWQSRAHAIAANSRPKHAQAAKLAKSSFSVYQLERYVLRKTKGQKALEIEEYTGGEVGW